MSGAEKHSITRRKAIQTIGLASVSTGVSVLATEAQPPSRELLLAYSEWLANERRLLCDELGGDERLVQFVGAGSYHWSSESKHGAPSTRARLALEAVGLDFTKIHSI
jgi:hypothetical protein